MLVSQSDGEKQPIISLLKELPVSEEIKNYLRLDRLFHCFCAYFDSEDYQADSLFIKHQVPVKFLQ